MGTGLLWPARLPSLLDQASGRTRKACYQRGHETRGSGPSCVQNSSEDSAGLIVTESTAHTYKTRTDI